MNRATVLVIVAAAVALAGYLYWQDSRTPMAADPTATGEAAQGSGH